MNNLESNNNIKEAIVETIAFFDLFDYPLTAWEVWKYLFDIKISYDELVEILANDNFDNRIEMINSFYIYEIFRVFWRLVHLFSKIEHNLFLCF